MRNMVGIYDVSRWTKLNRRESDTRKKLNVNVISDGITRLPVLEGEISQIELPRLGYNTLGVSIVGGADTPLRCVVIQEVFLEGLVSQDGRLLPGDQIVEIDGVDMTAATHQEVCDAFRKGTNVLRLGVYREKIETYRTYSSTSSPSSISEGENIYGNAYPYTDTCYMEGKHYKLNNTIYNEILDRALLPESIRRLGIKLGRHRSMDGIFIVEFASSTEAEHHDLRIFDKILYANGEDLKCNDLEYATKVLHQSLEKLHLIVERSSQYQRNRRNSESQDSLFGNDDTIWQNTSLSDQASECSGFEDETPPFSDSCSDFSRSSSDTKSSNEPQTIKKNTKLCRQIDRDILETSLREGWDYDKINSSHHPSLFQKSVTIKEKASSSFDSLSQVFGKRKHSSLVLNQKKISLCKKSGEGLGMRIGGGVNSNEGDTPIYVANINSHGPAGKSHQIRKGDIVLSVNGETLLGLTHSQAVALLKSTAELETIELLTMEGPETSKGRDNFIPSWLYWQKLPRYLHISKSVILHRQPGSSLGFSIVGGHDSQKGPEPIHVLFVVATSPAAIEGRLRSGDRLLAVDGRSLENVSHSIAVSLLKQAGKRVILEVVSWLGTEL